MSQFLDAVVDVTTPAVTAETFPRYAVTRVVFDHTRPSGNGRLQVTLCPCRDDGGTIYYNAAGSKTLNIDDPLDSPTPLMQAFLDAMVDMVAENSTLVNAATE